MIVEYLFEVIESRKFRAVNNRYNNNEKNPMGYEGVSNFSIYQK